MSLAKYVIHLQQMGRTSFTQKEATDELELSPDYLKVSANRLIKKKALFMPKRGFYVIVPIPNQVRGFIDPILYIHDLMKFLDSNYYIALLSAAQKFGAAHQQPQALQIMSQKQIKPIVKVGAHIRFYRKLHFPDSQYLTRMKVSSGYINVSSPELTALNLVQYPHACGQINNIATVLIELEESIKVNNLRKMLKNTTDLPSIQRLGFLFNFLQIERLSKVCTERLEKEKKSSKAIPLVPSKDYELAQLDLKWKIYVNENVEPDI